MAEAILGLDYGAKRVGLALAPPGEPPQRLVTLENGPDLPQQLADLLAQHAVGTVVVGLPRNLEGEDTAQTGTVMQFMGRLQTQLPQVKIESMDEALTSEEARKRLQQQGVKNPKEVLDQEAAVIILEDFLGL